MVSYFTLPLSFLPFKIVCGSSAGGINAFWSSLRWSVSELFIGGNDSGITFRGLGRRAAFRVIGLWAFRESLLLLTPFTPPFHHYRIPRGVLTTTLQRRGFTSTCLFCFSPFNPQVFLWSMLPKPFMSAACSTNRTRGSNGPLPFFAL